MAIYQLHVCETSFVTMFLRTVSKLIRIKNLRGSLLEISIKSAHNDNHNRHRNVQETFLHDHEAYSTSSKYLSHQCGPKLVLINFWKIKFWLRERRKTDHDQ